MEISERAKRLYEGLNKFWHTKIHFLELHKLYILILIFIISALFYCESGTNWNFVDALFMATTGSTNTGLNTVPMSEMSTYQMIVLYFSAFLGNHATVSFVVVLVRRYYFSRRFELELEVNRKRREEYKRQKALAKFRQETQSQTINHPIRRRLSFISTHSQLSNTSHFSLFPKKGRRKSVDMPPNMSSPLYTSNKPNQEESADHDSIHMDPLNNAETTGSNYSGQEGKEGQEGDDDYRDITVISNHSMSMSPTAYTITNPQITFSEDTNILQKRERQKLNQIRNQIGELQPAVNTADSEDEIMREPIAKSELTRNERYRIGGTEYRSLDMLARLVPIYYLGFIILFGFFFRIYVACSDYAQEVLRSSNSNGPVDPWFFSFFMSLSSYANLGLNHLDASMVPFQNAPAPLILAIILILVGNTAFAIVLRFIIWTCYKLTPKSKIMTRETYRYLLDHPRRCFTTLFPAVQTWWLLIILIAITLVELVCFLALNYWLPVLKGITGGSRFLDGLFQSVATRNAGFSVISLADLNPGTQLIYIVAMYISVYPVAISMRNSNIYQERALGIFRGDDQEHVEFSENELSSTPFINLKRHPTITSVMNQSKKLLKGPDFFVITQIQRQLTSDICWVITGIFLICVIEAEAIMSPSPITMATVIFECVSAFGNVGGSTGFPNTSTSQAAQYRTLSKLVLIALMYRGRHRGLPAAIDRSVMLPSEQLAAKEKEDDERRRAASISLANSTDMFGNNISNHLIYTRSLTL